MHTEHRSPLSPPAYNSGPTYLYWLGDGFPVQYRVGRITDPEVVPSDRSGGSDV